MRVFITGGTGYIGSSIVVELANAGHEVTILARNPSKSPELAGMRGVSFVHGSLDDLDLIRTSLKGHEACIHNAIYWEEEPTELELKDTRASVAIFEAAGKAGLEQIIYTSSVSVNRPFKSGANEDVRIQPKDFYGATKACSEMFLSAFSYEYPMRCNTVRPGPTIGVPVASGVEVKCHSRFKDYLSAARAGADIRVAKGDGRQFVGVRQLGQLYRAVLESGRNRETYLGIAGDFITWEAVANLTVAIVGAESKVILEELQDFELEPRLDVSKISRDFGFGFEAGPLLEAHIRHLAEATR
jgi:UDP-glucose 4-epimerase